MNSKISEMIKIKRTPNNLNLQTDCMMYDVAYSIFQYAINVDNKWRLVYSDFVEIQSKRL